jgi:flagellar biosynthetic protein FliR
VTDASVLLMQLPGLAFAFVLVLGRVGCACMLLPGLGETEIPVQLRAGFALALTALLLPVLSLPGAPDNVLRAAALLLAEMGTGLWLGWLTRLVLLALPLAGQIASSMLGLANVLQPDPALGGQTTALSHMLGLAAPVVVLSSGLYVLPLSALEGSYQIVPPGTWLPAADSALGAAEAVGECFAIAMRLAAPFVLGGIVWQVALGLLSRLVPQLQVYFAAMPGQILGGVVLLALLFVHVVGAWQDYAAAAYAALPGL